MKRIQLLKDNDVEPIVVFDGAKPKLKLEVEESRNANSEDWKQKGENLYEQAKKVEKEEPEKAGKLYKEADQYFQRAIRIKPELIRRLVEGLSSQNIECFVAPYEADGQLAWMVRNNRADIIITEDSDIPVFLCAARCSCKVFYKMDALGNGLCLPVRANHHDQDNPPLIGIPKPRKVHSKSTNNFLRSVGAFTPRMFVQMAVLAGCDYVESLSNIALHTAAEYINKYKSVSDQWRLQQIVSYLKGFTRVSIPEEYELRLLKAEACFMHHLVYNVSTKKVEPLTEIPTETFCPKRKEDSIKQIGEFSSPVTTTSKVSQSAESISGPASVSRPSASKINNPANETNSHTESTTDNDIIEILDDDEPPPNEVKREAMDEENLYVAPTLSLHRSWDFLGSLYDQSIAIGIAEGKLDPRTHERVSPGKGATVRAKTDNRAIWSAHVARSLSFSSESHQSTATPSKQRPDKKRARDTSTRTSSHNKSKKPSSKSLRNYFKDCSKRQEVDTELPSELQSFSPRHRKQTSSSSTSPEQLFRSSVGGVKKWTEK